MARWLGLLLLAAAAASADITKTVDYALIEHQAAWLRHPVYGDPSFDAFERADGNPIHRGTPPYEWPVNGFLFEDPVSRHWFLYVGNYLKGYSLTPDTPSQCTVFRSVDQGQHWEDLGPIFAPEEHLYEGEVSPLFSAPDVSVLYAEGRYHLCFDWATKNTVWANAAAPPPEANSGVGYAWSDRPEGPYHITPRPIATTREQKPLLGKYRRLYASTLIRRANDWLVLTLTDSGPYFGWALIGMSAAAPQGPYSTPKLLLHPESLDFHPPLLEFFPAFVHDGVLYAPATSVARNRNFQTLFCTALEQAMDPEAWAIGQLGSIWHAGPAEHEAYGIWGQTFSGFVAGDGTFQVMFPSRDRAGNGTINRAFRPWDTPYRPRGFVLSGHSGPSLAYLKRRGPAQELRLELEQTGTVRLLWDYTAPLGPDRPRSDASLHPLMLTRHAALELTAQGWALYEAGDDGERKPVAEGTLPAPEGTRAVDLAWQEDSQAVLRIDGAACWSGPLRNGPGAFALFTGAHSRAAVHRLAITGPVAAAPITYLYTEALVGAAQNMNDWEEQSNPVFRYGTGAVSKASGVQVKWNIEGTGFALWAPRGPEYGSAELYVDGVMSGVLQLHAPAREASALRYSRAGLEGTRHAIVVRARTGRFPVDAIDALP